MTGAWYVVRRLLEDRTQVQYFQYVSPEGTYRVTAATLPPPVPSLNYREAYQLLDREEAREAQQTSPLDGHWFLLGPGPQHLYGPDVPRRRQLAVPEFILGWLPDGPAARWEFVMDGLSSRGEVKRFAALGSAEDMLNEFRKMTPSRYPVDRLRVIAI